MSYAEIWTEAATGVTAGVKAAAEVEARISSLMMVRRFSKVRTALAGGTTWEEELDEGPAAAVGAELVIAEEMAAWTEVDGTDVEVIPKPQKKHWRTGENFQQVSSQELLKFLEC